MVILILVIRSNISNISNLLLVFRVVSEFAILYVI